MTARHWMQVVALALSLGLAGTAVATDTSGATSTDDTSGATNTDDRSSTSNPGMDTPSSGAIVMPEDKALGLGKGTARAGNRSGDGGADPSTLNDATSNDEELSAAPPPSSDEESSVSPGPSSDDKSIVKPPAVQR